MNQSNMSIYIKGCQSKGEACHYDQKNLCKYCHSRRVPTMDLFRLLMEEPLSPEEEKLQRAAEKTSGIRALIGSLIFAICILLKLLLKSS